MKDAWWGVLDNLIIILDWLMFYQLIEHMAVRKKCKSECIIIFSMMGVLLIFNNMLGIPANLKIIATVLMGIFYMKKCCMVQLKKAIVLSMFYGLLLIGLEAVGMMVVFAIHHLTDITMVIKESVYKIQGIAISKVLMYICIYAISKFSSFYEEIPRKYFLYILIPITTNLLNLFIMFENVTPGNEMFADKNMLIMSTLLIVISTIMFILLAGNMIKESKTNAEYALVKEKLDIQYKYYKGLEEEQQKVRKLYHDMRNHISCIQLLANNKAANEYIKKIEKELNGIKKYYDTGNPILDIILDDKQRECSEKQISFIAEVDFEKCSFIEMIDVTSLFSNVINNAIEACEKIREEGPEKKIKIKSTYVDNFFVLIATNSKVNKVKMSGKKVITDKEDHFVHGLGINNITTAANKYGGEVSINHTDYEFVVKMLIPLRKQVEVKHSIM